MAVDSKNDEYAAYYPQWERCEHAAEGQDEIHEYGVKFLPRLSGQTNEEYDAYKRRAMYFNATCRTIDGLTGMLFMRDAVVVAPDSMDYLLDDITMTGVTLNQLAEHVAEEVVKIGRCGVLVDHTPTTDAVTLAQAQERGLRPYARVYIAEAIINWKTGRVAGAEELILVVLEEQYEIPEDEFTGEYKPQWRVLDLSEGMYRQRVYRKTDKGEQVLVEELYPLLNGAPLSKIPFIFFGVRDNTPCVDKPPLLDLVDVNLSHYRTSADYEHGLHFTGLPTPVVTGYYSDDQSAQLRIGSGTAWLLPDPAAKAFYLEFTGQGLSELREALRAKESMMATLGARILAPDKRDAESSQTATIHRAGENSVLASIAKAISLGLTRTLEITRDWAGITGDVSIEINRDYLPNSMTAQDVQVLVQAWQVGAISHESLFDNLVRGEILGLETNFLDEQEKIDMNPPGGIGMSNPNPQPTK
jgi:hypothetical protein